VSILKNSGPDSMLLAFDKENETPELIWDSETRKELRSATSDLLDQFYQLEEEHVKAEFCLPPGYAVKYKKLQEELFIGGVYVRLFLKDPTYNLRDASGFLEMLLQRWSHELEATVNIEGRVETDEHHTPDCHVTVTTAKQDVLELVTSASVYLCKLHSYLCIKLAQWGYMCRAIGFLQTSVTSKLIGTPLLSAIRLIHVAALERDNVEAIALVEDSEGKHGFVEGIMKAIDKDHLHPDSAFMVETLNRVVTGVLGNEGSDSQKIESNQFTNKYNNSVAKQCELQNVDMLQNRYNTDQSSQDGNTLFNPDSTRNSQTLIIAPSPASGIEPVKKLKDANSDHPLAMFFEPNSAPLSIPSDARIASESQRQRRSTTQQSSRGPFPRQNYSRQISPQHPSHRRPSIKSPATIPSGVNRVNEPPRAFKSSDPASLPMRNQHHTLHPTAKQQSSIERHSDQTQPPHIYNSDQASSTPVLYSQNRTNQIQNSQRGHKALHTQFMNTTDSNTYPKMSHAALDPLSSDLGFSKEEGESGRRLLSSDDRQPTTYSAHITKERSASLNHGIVSNPLYASSLNQYSSNSAKIQPRAPYSEKQIGNMNLPPSNIPHAEAAHRSNDIINVETLKPSFIHECAQIPNPLHIPTE